ncbi:DNA mismatch repair protein Mlh1 [Rhodotorula sphaerocarpa]
MSADKPPAAPIAPRAIAKLPEAVIIQRPSNALKELIENSLDAGATSIRVTVKEGGLKLLQIQDNGTGIRKDDLPILCERFTTSKIRAYEDLSSIGTYGFRGEALASISHVAHLSVTTKTRDESCAWKAAYADGAMIPVKSGSSDASAIPCAGNDGTVLVVEDLFYNTPQRLRSLRSATDEYARIVSVVLAYSIHNAGVAMSCRKTGSGTTNSTADINTSVGASVIDNIGLHYGDAVKRELVEVNASSEELNVKVSAWCSGANFQAKKSTFLFFINHRYVDCSSLKRALEAFYGTLLAKGTHPFVYLSLEIDPTKVDVNVHPTKKEVGFEDEDEVVELVCEELAKVLEKQGQSRSYKVQTLLPTAGPPKAAQTMSGTSSSSVPNPTPVRQGSGSSKMPKVAPNKLVRTDAQSQTLDALFPSAPKRPQRNRSSDLQADDEDADAADGANGHAEEERPTKMRKSDHDPAFAARLAADQAAQTRARIRIAQSECALTSVKQLRKEVIEARHEGLDAIIKGHIFVGVVDLVSCQSVIQHQTKLYLIGHARLAEELFYQLGLRQFGRFSRIKLTPAPSLRKLLKLAVDRASADNPAPVPTHDIVEKVVETLTSAAPMLEEYFSMTITEQDELASLPLVLPGHAPDLDKLPLFLLRLGAHVDWENEKPCFQQFLRELAYFYSPAPSPVRMTRTSSHSTDPRDEAARRTIEHVLFPAAKQYLVAPAGLLEKDVVLATSLEALFRVFERC